MKGKQKIDYCSKEFVYPKEAFLVFIRVVDGQNMDFYYPMNSIYTARTDISADIERYAHNVRDGLGIADETLVFPIRLTRLYPLRSQFWEAPILHYDDVERMKQFWKIIDAGSFYRIIVTPMPDKIIDVFSPALPIFTTENDRTIEQFMLKSDYPVDERAKHAGIYSPERPFTYNWCTGEMESVKKMQMAEDVN